jgi:Secretory lipase
MIKRLFFFCIACISFYQLNAQHLLSSTQIASFTSAQVDSIFTANGIPFNATLGIHCYRLVYSTQNAKQTDTTIASGLVIVPDSYTCPMAIAMYDHGTVLQKFDVPSNLNYESLISMILAEQGYYSIAPDYLGLGVSPGFHPYIHARSEAQAGIDLIFASKAFASTNAIPLSQQLFLTGYSQGGHACMATHRAIQQNYAGQLTVTASAPGSGPYNLSGIQAAGLASNNYYADPSYVPYIVIGYQSVYGNLYDSIPQFLQHPWDSILPPLFNGQYSTDTVDMVMPHHIDSFVVDSQLIRYTSDSVNDPLRIDLRDNDVYAWVPRAPIQNDLLHRR